VKIIDGFTVLAPEDRQFVNDCLENDDIVLTTRRTGDKRSSVQYIIDVTGCHSSIAYVVVDRILK
jgi:flavin-dependent dehydrogenase